MNTLTVELGARRYPIHIEAGLLDRLGTELLPLAKDARILVVADQNVAGLYGPRVMASLTHAGLQAALVAFPAGEAHKSIASAEQLWRACAHHRLDRGGLIVALGGGVTGDLAGFVAATWMRGIRLVQVPTTLLAMVDSSVGGKTGVDLPEGKNLVGAIKQPIAVFIDPSVLASLAQREIRAGLVEVLKYGVIRQSAFLDWQEQHAAALLSLDPEAIAYAVKTSCTIKAWYVQNDEEERGVRAELNYGHTFGHALEVDGAYADLLHGEAIAVGMRMAAFLARSTGVLQDSKLIARQDALLRAYGLNLQCQVPDSVEAATHRLAAHCRLDKKVQAGSVRFILPVKAGEVVIRRDLPTQAILDAFAHGLQGPA